jgi:hypothetical protein
MASTITILSAVVLTILAAVVVWIGRRRPSTVGPLKDVTVSRQWLIQHQTDDRP